MRTRSGLMIALLLGLLSLAAPARAGPFGGGVFVFGDSLSDTGNNAVFLDAAFAPAQPRTPTPIAGNGFIPDLPYASGRYSNDMVWAEVFAQSLGLSATASLLGGSNLAFGGARTGPVAATFPVPFPPTLATQVGAFITLAGGAIPGDALYVVAGGGNNARDALVAILGGADIPTTIGQTALGYAADISAMLIQLRGAGAQNVVVWNSPNLGVAPAVLEQGPLASYLATTIATSMNAQLVGALEAFPGVKLFDLFDVITDIVADKNAFGLTNVTEACAQFANCVPSEFLFWDGVHPTSAGHLVLAEAMVRTVPAPSTLLLMALAGACLLLMRTRMQ